MYTFKTSDPAATVIQFYESELEKVGYAATQKLGVTGTTVLSSGNGDRTVTISATVADGQTSVNITFGAKK
jgi:hypothetical protein